MDEIIVLHASYCGQVASGVHFLILGEDVKKLKCRNGVFVVVELTVGFLDFNTLREFVFGFLTRSNVAWVRIMDPASLVGRACCWCLLGYEQLINK